MSDPNPPYIFISYANSDGADYAERLADSLRNCGCQVFLAEDSIPAGGPFLNILQNALIEATHMVVILTQGSNESQWVHREVLNFERRGKRVIPSQFLPVPDMNLLFENQNRINFMVSANYQQSFSRLLDSLQWECQPTSRPSWKDRLFIELNMHVSKDELDEDGFIKLKCITPNNTIDEATKIMRNSGLRIRHLLVTADGKAGSELLGIISLRHILKNAQTRLAGRPFATRVEEVMDWYRERRSQGSAFNYLTIADSVEVMLKQFITRLTKDHEQGAMRHFYMSALPIIDNQKNAIGIISFKDVCNAILRIPTAFPIPSNTSVGEIMEREPITSYLRDTVQTIKIDIGVIGQRDAFIVDKRSQSSKRLLGMIPDSYMIEREEDNPIAEDIGVPFSDLKLQTEDTPIHKMLEIYASEGKLYYYLAVVDALNTLEPPLLLGAISYLEIFKFLHKLP